MSRLSFVVSMRSARNSRPSQKSGKALARSKRRVCASVPWTVKDMDLCWPSRSVKKIDHSAWAQDWRTRSSRVR
jgi:hypothetical protein